MNRVLVALVSLAAAGPVSGVADDKLWARLKSEPNMAVLMRHTATTGNPIIWDPSGGCKDEAMVNDEGRKQARHFKAAFESRGIKPTVISSPMCRCRETAELVFGGLTVTDPLLRETDSADDERKKAFLDKARALLRQKRGKAPIVFISHRPNIYQLTQGPIDYEEMVVAKVDAKGGLAVVGKIKVLE